ncbi:hypothetical protein CEXT_565291 [Caerostris extrusa]|uniref:Uncharacterized protein n=1 Tax=Caerostris extrusa TaxID=172846 RepID=A0AAV4TQS4_CAEEX|nr:hypothetical protein CEXT_565291 [Caerostris extrusa]
MDQMNLKIQKEFGSYCIFRRTFLMLCDALGIEAQLASCGTDNLATMTKSKQIRIPTVKSREIWLFCQALDIKRLDLCRSKQSLLRGIVWAALYLEDRAREILKLGWTSEMMGKKGFSGLEAWGGAPLRPEGELCKLKRLCCVCENDETDRCLWGRGTTNWACDLKHWEV